MRHANVQIYSFLRDQEILEADAREALPYVRHTQALHPSSIANCFISTEHRNMHQDSRPASTERFRLFDLQPCADKA